MKPLGWVLVALGIVVALLTFDLINGNAQLAVPGQPVVMGALQDSWRYLFGFLALVSATLLAAGAILIRRLPGLSYLALAVFVILSVPYIVGGGTAPSFSSAVVIWIVLVVVIPVVVFLIATLIGRAVTRRRARNESPAVA